MIDENDIREMVRQIATDEMMSLMAQYGGAMAPRGMDQAGWQGVNGAAADLIEYEGGGDGPYIPKAFDLVLEYDSVTGDTTVTLRDCVFWRRGIFTYIGDLDTTLSSSDLSPQYIAHQFDDETGVHSLITGHTLADVAFTTTINAIELKSKYPKYELTKNTDGTWRCILDFRSSTSGLMG